MYKYITQHITLGVSSDVFLSQGPSVHAFLQIASLNTV